MRCSASTPVSPACWLCILPSRPLSAFGLDDRAKVSAFTSGADPRSTGPTTLSSPMGAPAPAPGALRSRCRSAELRVKRTHNFALYGRRRPGKTAIRTALPRRLLTRKGSQVQTLSRPPARMALWTPLLSLLASDSPSAASAADQVED